MNTLDRIIQFAMSSGRLAGASPQHRNVADRVDAAVRAAIRGAVDNGLLRVADDADERLDRDGYVVQRATLQRLADDQPVNELPTFVTREHVIEALRVLGIDAAQARAVQLNITQVGVQHQRVGPDGNPVVGLPDSHAWQWTTIPVWETDGSLVNGPRTTP